jgi:hypothetical protein
MMDGTLLPEMAVTANKAERQVGGLEWPINQHLVKLLALDAPDATRAAWKRELREWFGQIATLRIKPSARRLPAHTLFGWIYDERFGGSEVQNVTAMLALHDDMPRNARTAEEVADALLAFHAEAARLLASGQIPTALIAAL